MRNFQLIDTENGKMYMLNQQTLIGVYEWSFIHSNKIKEIPWNILYAIIRNKSS